MELMKEIDKLAQDYTPPVVEDIRTERMLKSMTPPKDAKPAKVMKKKGLVDTMKDVRAKNGWK